MEFLYVKGSNFLSFKNLYYKIKNGQNVTTDVLLRICNTLDCDISDVMECVEFETEEIKDEID